MRNPAFAITTFVLLASAASAATNITQDNLSVRVDHFQRPSCKTNITQGTWVGVRASAAYARNESAKLSGGCINDDILDVFFTANINTTDDAVLSNMMLTVLDDAVNAVYTLPVTTGNGDFRGSQIIGGIDAYRTGFNGTAILGNGTANVTIPAQNGLNATTSCLRWDVQVDKPGKAVTMKTSQEIRMLFANGTVTPIPAPCPATLAPGPICTDTRATAPARAPAARAPAPATRAPAPAPTASVARSYFANCTRASQSTQATEDLATCLAYLAYGLQTPAAQQRPDSTSRLAQCYTALSDGDDFTTNQARTCIVELRSLYNATIGGSTTAASSFCSSSGVSNCATCAWCQAQSPSSARCNGDCTLVDDFPDVSIDGETYTIYPESVSSFLPTTPSVPTTPGSSSQGSTVGTPGSQIITADRDTVNLVSALLGEIGGGNIGSFGRRKLLNGRSMLAIRPLGGVSTSSSTDLSQLPAGAYVISSVVTATLRCTEGACLDLLK